MDDDYINNYAQRTGYVMISPQGAISFHTLSSRKTEAAKKLLISPDEDWEYWKDGWDCIAVEIIVRPMNKKASNKLTELK